MKFALAAMVLACVGCSVTVREKESSTVDDRPPEASGDYLPATYYLAFEPGRVPENWRPCVMTEAAAGASGQAQMTDTHTNDKFYTSKFVRTRPATAADITVGAKVYVMVQWGVALREKGAAARQFKQPECEWLETTVTGTQGLDAGLFQAPHRETNDIHISNARVAK